MDGGGEDPYIEGWNKMISRCVYHGSRTLKREKKRKETEASMGDERESKKKTKATKENKEAQQWNNRHGGLQTIVQNQPVV